MDKLQWFKFAPSDWAMGKIMRCDEITQARFIRLCCLYWNKECVLSMEDAEIEIDEDHLTVLIKKKIIKEYQGNILIEFLDDQMSDILETSNKRRESVNKRWKKTIVEADSTVIEEDTTLIQSDTLVLENDTDKSREDEIRVDEITPKPPEGIQAVKMNFENLLLFFNKTFGKRSTVISQTVKNKYNARIKEGFTKEQISSAMKNAAKDQYHIETNFKHCTLEFFSRADKIDKFSSTSEKPADQPKTMSTGFNFPKQ